MSKPIAIGDVVAGKYALLRVIGEGGMGVVYLAEHNLIEKRVALKVLRAELASNPEVVGRFQQEAISASRIKHPNVLDVFDFGPLDDGSYFMAMEYLEGRDLAAELAEHSTLSAERAIRIALQMSRALAAAHARGVVHRDLKPENVFLHRTEEGDEVVKIVDFGIAQLRGKEDEKEAGTRRRRLTRAGMIFGTPEYMSPEQAAGRAVDLRSDIYAVGVMLYEMFTGAVPFTGNSFMAVLSAHLTQPLPPMTQHCPELEISVELEQAIMRALEKDPAARFQSMRELASALQQAPEGRLASPLGALLPLPEVSVASFRPARGPSPDTVPAFTKPDPLPFDLMRRGDEPADGRRGERSSPGASQRALTAPAQDWGAEEAAASLATSAAPGRGRAKTALIVALALLAGALGSYGYRQQQVRSSQVARAARAAEVRDAAPRVTATLPVASSAELPAASSLAVAPSASAPVANKAVVLTVQTNLPEAIVLKDGFQVCDATPCSVEVERGTAVELTAAKGHARGIAKVLAQQDQTVNIQLVFPKGGPKKAATKPGLCEVTVDGLKILRPCQ